MITMKVNLKTTGFENISKNLNSYLKNLDSNVFDACAEAAAMVRAAANETLTPVDTGELVATSFDINIVINGNPGAEIVYIKFYAMVVELNPKGFRHGAEYNAYYGEGLRKPTERSSFLYTAVSRNTKQVFEIIKGAAVNVTV